MDDQNPTLFAFEEYFHPVVVLDCKIAWAPPVALDAATA
jgi:hypothetical protein